MFCHGLIFYLWRSLPCILEKAMTTHSSTLAWKLPWTEEPSRLQSMGSLESDMTEWLQFHFSLSCMGEGNGNPLLCSCLENLRDGGAWWAAVNGVAQSRTQLKRLSSSSSSSIKFSLTALAIGNKFKLWKQLLLELGTGRGKETPVTFWGCPVSLSDLDIN